MYEKRHKFVQFSLTVDSTQLYVLPNQSIFSLFNLVYVERKFYDYRLN